MEPIEITYGWVAETKNNHKYQATTVPDGVIVQPLYLHKTTILLGQPRPEVVTMTITFHTWSAADTQEAHERAHPNGDPV